MSYKDFMNTIRYWDNKTAKWMMRHFYFMFFQLVLVIIFFFWFYNTMVTIDTNFRYPAQNTVDQLMMNQSINMCILVLIVLLNSFWLLYIFSSMQRMTNLLKDISHHISRLRIQKN